MGKGENCKKCDRFSNGDKRVQMLISLFSQRLALSSSFSSLTFLETVLKPQWNIQKNACHHALPVFNFQKPCSEKSYKHKGKGTEPVILLISTVHL